MRILLVCLVLTLVGCVGTPDFMKRDKCIDVKGIRDGNPIPKNYTGIVKLCDSEFKVGASCEYYKGTKFGIEKNFIRFPLGELMVTLWTPLSHNSEYSTETISWEFDKEGNLVEILGRREIDNASEDHILFKDGVENVPDKFKYYYTKDPFSLEEKITYAKSLYLEDKDTSELNMNDEIPEWQKAPYFPYSWGFRNVRKKR